jgi:hypothetical protein
VRIDIRRIAAIENGEVVTGNRTKVKIVKTRWRRHSGRPSSSFDAKRLNLSIPEQLSAFFFGHPKK